MNREGCKCSIQSALAYILIYNFIMLRSFKIEKITKREKNQTLKRVMTFIISGIKAKEIIKQSTFNQR